MNPKEILELLQLRGWSQAELARRLETHPTTVGRWVEGKEPAGPAKILMRLWLEDARANAAEAVPA